MGFPPQIGRCIKYFINKLCQVIITFPVNIAIKQVSCSTELKTSFNAVADSRLSQAIGGCSSVQS